MLKKWRALNTMIQKSGLDWLLHGLFAIGTSSWLFWLTSDYLDTWVVSVVAFGMPVLVGLMKELSDLNFDWKDLAHYVVGSGATVLVWNLV